MSNIRYPRQFVMLQTFVSLVVIFTFFVAGSASSAVAASDLGAAKRFAVLSANGDVSFKNRVNIAQVNASGSTTCPGAVECPGNVGGTTVLDGTR